MKIEKYVCDNCGKEKQTSNHWFLIYGLVKDEISIRKWESKDSSESWLHACGQQCVSEMSSRWMTMGKLVEEKSI